MVAGVIVIEVPLNEPGCHVYVVAPVPVMAVEAPAQMLEAVTVVPTDGSGLTVIIRVVVLLQPVTVAVPVTVYVVVAAGETMTVVPDNPPGCHVYVFAPVPVIDTLSPAQMEALVTFVPTEGKGFTVMVRVAVFTQPFALVPVTV